jgi:hypothetical protein
MCDALSLASAGTDVAGGFAGFIDARSKASFETSQLEAFKTLASARSLTEGAGLRRSYSDARRGNIAAAAISGFASASFASVEAGNQADLERNLGQLSANLQSELAGFDAQQAEAKTAGRLGARAALLGGFKAAGGRLHDAEKAYQEYHTKQTRKQSLLKSLGRE